MGKKALIIFGIVSAVSLQFAEAQSLPTLNGYQLNASQAKWVEYIAKEVVPLVGADVAARGTWWTLKEGVLDVQNPIGLSNCAQRPGGPYKGNEHVGFLDLCKEGVTWQVGIAGVQVPNHSDEAVRDKMRELYPGKSESDVIAEVATRAGYSAGSTEYNGAINSTGYLRRSLLLRDPAIGFGLVYGDIGPCLDVARRAGLQIRGDDWCRGYGVTVSIATTVDVTNQVISELANYYKNFAGGAPSEEEEEEQKEVSLGLAQQIGNFYAWALGIGGLIALGVLIFGGILYTTSAGNASRQDDAKQWIWGALIGLLLLFGSYIILNTINPELTKLTDLKLLANKAAEGLSDNEETSPQEGGVVVIDGKACPLGNNPTITDSCGAPRAVGTGGQGHEGIDISSTLGTSLYAMEDGVIGDSWGWDNAGGWRFWLYGDSGDKYYYAHLYSMDGVPRPGTRVSVGDPIAKMGNTGETSPRTGGEPGAKFASHLHLGWQSKAGGTSCGAPSRGYHNPTQLLKALCEAGVGGAAEVTVGSPELTQILNKPQYSGLGIVFQEVGGQGASVNSSKGFPIASLYKLFLAKWAYDQKLDFNQKIPLWNVGSCSRQGAGFTGSGNLLENCQDGVGFLYQDNLPREGQLVSINDCMQKMIIYSDNVCGSSLLHWAGDKKGYSGPGGLSEYSATSIADLLNSIKNIPGIYNLMLQQYHDKKIPAGAPSGAEVANKTGELHESNYSHDAAIIKYKGKTYVLVVMTNRDPDTPSTNQTIQQLTREIFSVLR